MLRIALDKWSIAISETKASPSLGTDSNLNSVIALNTSAGYSGEKSYSLLLSTRGQQKALKKFIFYVQNHGINPEVYGYIDGSISLLLVGFDDKLCAVDLLTSEVAFCRTLDSLFHATLGTNRQQQIIVLHEIGLCAVSLQGDMVWNYSKDVVINLDRLDDLVHLEFMDASKATVRLANGLELD